MGELTIYGTFMFLTMYTMLIYCAYTDVKTMTLKNYATIPVWFIGMGLNYLESGINGLQASLLGLVVMFLLFLLPYLFNQLGAGDVKLVMALGALMGTHYAAGVIITGSILAAVYAVWKWFKTRSKTIQFPYGLFICLGAFLYEGMILLMYLQ